MSIYGPHRTAGQLTGGLPGRFFGRSSGRLVLDLPLRLQVAGMFCGGFQDDNTIAAADIAQENDGDIRVVITVVDGSNLPVDLSAATALSIVRVKPDGLLVTTAASFATNGMDGKMLIALGPTDLADAGLYTVQGALTIAGLNKTTRKGYFRVEAALA